MCNYVQRIEKVNAAGEITEIFRCSNMECPSFGKKVPADHCQEQAEYHPEPSRGLGDTFAWITKKVGIEPCEGCKQRQEILNRWVPYKN